MKPSVANKFYSRYDGSPLPPKNIAQNVLATFDVPADRTVDVYELVLENARFVGFLKMIKGEPRGVSNSRRRPHARRDSTASIVSASPGDLSSR